MVTVKLELLVVECEDEAWLLATEWEEELEVLVVEKELVDTAVPFTLLVGDTRVSDDDIWPVPLWIPVGLKDPDECGKPEPRMLPDGSKLPDGCAKPVAVLM